MRDNLSIAILMILLVLVMIMFPLYNYFERQDDMSYNLALKATTNFVDEVLNSGYIDQDMYDRLITQLSNTGNLYDIQLEAHKKLLVEDLDNKGTYIEKSIIDYNDDIFNDFSENQTDVSKKELKNRVYKLNVGDGFYIKLKNSTTTMAGAIFNSIITTSSKDRIVVNYGGIVKNNSWAKVDATYNAKEYSSDVINYIESEYDNSVYRIIYFNDVSGDGYAINLKGKNGSYTFSTNESSETKELKDENILTVTSNSILAIKADKGTISLTATNQDTKKAATFEKYNSEYASDGLICNYESNYRVGYRWPSMVNANVSGEAEFNIATVPFGLKVFDTKNRFDYSEEAQEKGYTLEAVVQISSDDLINANQKNGKSAIIGDLSSYGGIGIHYGKAKTTGKIGILSLSYLENVKKKTPNEYGLTEQTYEYSGVNQKIKCSMTVKYDKAADKTEINLYYNGKKVLTESQEGKLVEKTDKANIYLAGESVPGELNVLKGSISSVQIYNRALSEKEIVSNYNISNNKYFLN